MNRLFGYFVCFSLAVILSGCCSDGLLLDRGGINVNSITENRKGLFSLVKLQIPNQPGQGQPLSLTTADLNNDGTPDMITSYASDTGGMLMFHMGEVNFAHSKSRQAATNSPFSSTAELLEVPIQPDFVFTG